MSAETSQWLNTMTLIGMTEKRGNAWHYRAEHQGDESNHYPGEIPVEDVNRRLFNFTVEKTPFYVPRPSSIQTFTREKNGAAWKYTATDSQVEYVEVPGRIALVASDNGDVLGVHKDGYEIHDPSRWLLEETQKIVGDSEDGLKLASAGLLQNRAVAWAQFELSENVETPEGFTFRPFLTSQTSYNGTLPTEWFTGEQAVVCDNTLSLAGRTADKRFRVRHTKYSQARLAKAGEALGLVLQDAEKATEVIARLAALEVTTREFDLLCDALMPTKEEGLSKKAVTMNEKKKETIRALFFNDPRVNPWVNTGLGVFQAFNTYRHHESIVRSSTNVAQKNMLAALNGTGAKADNAVMDALAKVKAMASV